MKAIKLIVAVAMMAMFFASCKTQTCPGYGEAESQEVSVNA